MSDQEQGAPSRGARLGGLDFTGRASGLSARTSDPPVELARRRLAEGDAAGARAILDAAVRHSPGDAALWTSLAAAHARLGRADAELEALERALAIAPHNLTALLRAAALRGRRGDLRIAAAAYRTALQGIPQGAMLTPEIRQAVQDARAVIDANNRALESFLTDRLRPARTAGPARAASRFDKAVDTLLLKRPVYRPQPSFLYFPELPAIEFFDRDLFPWLDALEAATDDIRRELLAVMASEPHLLEPYVAASGEVNDTWRELNNSRRWSAGFLWREGVPRPDLMARCPATMAALRDWPGCDLPGCGPTAMFSILQPRTRIPPHTGVNNSRLVAHLPLVVPPGCGFRVGAETRAWEPGKAFVFDDTIEHEAWNDSDDWRAVLIVDIWNPFLTEAEREMVRALTAGVGDYYGELPPYIQPPQRPN